MRRHSAKDAFRTHARTWSVITGLLLALSWGPAAGAKTTDTELKDTLDRILADKRLAGAAASVVVGEADTGRVLYEHRPDSRLTPASNTKLPTSAAAMEILGPDHRFHTDVLADGERSGRVLEGDLYLRGTGDPTMLAADYGQLAAEVAASGIDRVTGSLVADDTRFDDRRLGQSWSADYESAYYAAQISPLTVAPDTDYDAGTVRIDVAPGAAAGEAPKVTVTPPTDYVTLDVRATTVAKGDSADVSVEREHGGNTIVVSGSIPAGAGPVRSWTSVWEPTGYAAAVFADALAEHGVSVEGGIRLGEAAPEGAEVLARRYSMPLKDLLVPFMKLSNNNHAEVLTKAIGYETSRRGTWSAGLSAIADYLKGEGVDTDALRQVDGSGLSRMNLFSGRQFVRLLTAVRDEAWFGDWYASLPVACAEDRFTGGTLRSRMCGTAAEGNVHAKTGTLTGASGLSGYVTDADGRALVFSVLLNQHLASSVKDIEDAVAVTLASYGGEDGKKGGGTAGTLSSPRSAPAGVAAAGLECSWTKPRGC